MVSRLLSSAFTYGAGGAGGIFAPTLSLGVATSSGLTGKFVEIIYFLIPTGIVIAGIIFWEKNYGKNIKKDSAPQEKDLK